jgi:uncharacterized membrane protein YphA (DoxX/SURF4 family)
MKILTTIVRILLGLVFTVFGSNAFLHFMPMPPMPGPGGAFIGAMNETHYLYVVAGCQVLGGLILLIGRYIPLGLTLLGPVIVNILCFHIFMDRKGLPIAVVVAALALFLVYRHWKNFVSLLRP